MIKKAFLAAILVLPLMTSAAEFPWLTFLLADDTEVSVAAENLDINYSDGNLLLASGTVNQAIPVDQIKSMKFTSYSAGIRDVIENKSGEAEYFDLSGIKVGTFPSLEVARKSLPSGTYIGKSDIKTFKVIF